MLLVNLDGAGGRRFTQQRYFSTMALLVLAVVLGTGNVLSANASPLQDSDNSPEQSGQRQMPTVDDQLQKLTQALSLSDDQQSKIKLILENQRKQMEAIRNDSSGSRRDRFSKMREVHSNTVSQVKEVLNDDQKKKYDEIQGQMKQEGRKRMRQR